MLRPLLYIAFWLALGSFMMTVGLLMENGPLWGLALGLTIYKVFVHLMHLIHATAETWADFQDAIRNAFSGSQRAAGSES